MKSKREGITASIITLLAVCWTAIDLIYEVPIFFTLFGMLSVYVAGRKAFQYWRRYLKKKE